MAMALPRFNTNHLDKVTLTTRLLIMAQPMVSTRPFKSHSSKRLNLAVENERAAQNNGTGCHNWARSNAVNEATNENAAIAITI